MTRHPKFRAILSVVELESRLAPAASNPGPTLVADFPPGGETPSQSSQLQGGQSGQTPSPFYGEGVDGQEGDLPGGPNSPPAGQNGFFRPGDPPGDGGAGANGRNPLDQKDPNFAWNPRFADLDSLVRYLLARGQIIRSGGMTMGPGCCNGTHSRENPKFALIMTVLEQQVQRGRNAQGGRQDMVEINGVRWVRNLDSDGPDRFWHQPPPPPRFLGNPARGPVPTTD